jgi:hypothetical protein
MQQVHMLTQANNNADHMIEQLVQERNEAWDKRDLLRKRVDELEEYNVNLHKEFHMLYNGVSPYAPPDTASMDIDDDDKDEPELHLVAMVTSPTLTMALRSRLVALR